MAQRSMQPHIVIIGAGVIGLSTAVLLQERIQDLQITIVAAEFPSPPPLPASERNNAQRPSADYASMWAGAHYRPIPRSTRQLEQEAEMCFRTAARMKEIARVCPEAGVQIVPAEEYLESTPADYLALRTQDLYAGKDDEFRVVEEKDLPAGIKWGCHYQAYVVNVHVYCAWLLGKFRKLGGHVVKQRLGQAEDLFRIDDRSDVKLQSLPSIVVNCSGRNFDQDSKTQIIRGQTVLVRNQYHKTVTRQNKDGSWSFLIPRPLNGGTIVGGTKEIGDHETEPSIDSRKRLLEHAAKFFPDFVANVAEFDVIMDNVGRRPWREGGLRIELEELGRGRQIVHGYGAGGRGYELSWAAAENIVDLVQHSLQGQRVASKI